MKYFSLKYYNAILNKNYYMGEVNLLKRKKKILFVMMNLYNGGAEKSMVNLLKKYDIPFFFDDISTESFGIGEVVPLNATF